LAGKVEPLAVAPDLPPETPAAVAPLVKPAVIEHATAEQEDAENALRAAAAQEAELLALARDDDKESLDVLYGIEELKGSGLDDLALRLGLTADNFGQDAQDVQKAVSATDEARAFKALSMADAAAAVAGAVRELKAGRGTVADIATLFSPRVLLMRSDVREQAMPLRGKLSGIWQVLAKANNLRKAEVEDMRRVRREAAEEAKRQAAALVPTTRGKELMAAFRRKRDAKSSRATGRGVRDILSRVSLGLKGGGSHYELGLREAGDILVDDKARVSLTIHNSSGHYLPGSRS
jgi:hypothetical protein